MIKTLTRYQAYGKRKTAIAIVSLITGSGEILINNKIYTEFFKNLGIECETLKLPLLVTNLNGNYDIKAQIQGGGLSAQLNALKLAISKAILLIDTSFRPALNHHNLLHRDARIKERRKYGLKKARKAPQFSKR